jgi:type II secretion system protein J
MIRRGFTLVELVLAAVIGVFVAGAVTASLSQMIRARGASQSRQQAHSRAESAASRIAVDLRNVVRDSDLRFAQVAVTTGTGPGGNGLILLAKGTRPVRGDVFTPEGENYEVQYRVEVGAGGIPVLWRRVDPAFDPYIDGGGVAAPTVPGVVSLKVMAYDGQEWYEEWRSDEHGMPHAVRVTVEARSDDGRYRATARRVVAIDRVPLPAETASEASPAGGSGAGPQPSSPGGSGAGTSENGRSGGTGGGSGGGGGGGGRSGNGQGNTGGGARPGGSGGTGSAPRGAGGSPR